MFDTICAVATSSGVGSISIIRVSGKESINIVNSLFKGRNLTKVESHNINYGHIIYKEEIIDEVLVSVMRAPKTFTTEDTVEINCHGGIITTKKVLETLLLSGVRQAEPGEFTKRAYLNGRIDLIKAEGIMDLINAKTDNARKLALNEISGKVSNLISDLREQLISIIANIEVNIDYPEYLDIHEITNDEIKPKVSSIKAQIAKIIKESESGKIIKEGIKTAIIGRPNAGKSSLLNNLLEYEKAIVTDIAGTTRDIVEGTIVVDGIVLNIIDTAGIRQSNDVVESIGIKKSIETLEEADLVLFMLNNNEELNGDELQLLEKIKNKKHIIVINKIDLENKLNIDNENTIKISALKNIGIDQLKEKIKELFNLGQLEQQDLTYLTNARSLAILKKASLLIEEVEKGIEANMPIDMLEIDIKEIWQALGTITGETYEDELVDQLFSRFCLGK